MEIIVNLEIFMKLGLAVLIGLLIGRERKRHDKSGGSRTMAVICMSSCLITIFSLKLSTEQTFDFARLMQGALQGIGFIGMGLIFKYKGDVEGLTTASTLFSLMIIGFCLGLAYYLLAITSALAILIILEMKYWTRRNK